MILDKNALNRLLSLDDRQLKAVMERLAAESGLDLSAFNVSTGDLASVRTALSGATDQELEKLAQQLRQGKKERGV
jgi:hypothetical protein